MVSEFDKAKVDEILAGYGDWFTAHLMRYIGNLPNHLRANFADEFPDVVAVVSDKDTTGDVPSFDFLTVRADTTNRIKLIGF